MRIIDAHMHASNIAAFNHCARDTSRVDYTPTGYLAEARRCGVVKSVCMGLLETVGGGFPDAGAPALMCSDWADLPPEIAMCIGINPHKLDADALDAARQLLRGGRAVGFKIYGGYYHFDFFDAVYDTVYDIAEEFDVPVAIHTGDTYSTRGLLALSHPLNADRLAVMRPKLKIILCHMGVPWVFDACEVACKNENVYIDLSGMLVGDGAFIKRMSAQALLLDRYRQALVYMEGCSKVLFGTDWPLAPMEDYIEFVKLLVPQEAWGAAFHDNAARLFKLLD